MDQEIKDRLTSSAELTALVGDRVYPVIAQQGDSDPYLVYFKVSPNRDYTLDGFSGLQQPRYQVSCFATKHHIARQVADLVVTRLESWGKGVMNDGDQVFYDSEAKLFHIALDFLIWFEEE